MLLLKVMKWYRVSIFGWLFTLGHLLLSLFLVKGYFSEETYSPALHLYDAAFVIELFLLALLIYVWFKKEKLFAA